jgi:hypothetical protein
MRKNVFGLIGALAVAASTAALADNPNDNQRGTMIQAEQSVSRNQAENPDSPGLAKAHARLIENSGKHLENDHGRGADRADRAQGADRAERVERVERVERAERPERPERAERPERPERVERVTRVDLPDRPGKGH